MSNVIGSLNPRYGLFGDTVNTASRMESNSYSGKIHCSEASAKLLKEQAPDLPLTKRGKVNVKGKGSMTTYWVGEGLLQEELDGSISRTYDDHPVVAFKESNSPVRSKKNKAGTLPPTRLCMDGSLQPATQPKILKPATIGVGGAEAPVVSAPQLVRSGPSSAPVSSKNRQMVIPEIPKFKAASPHEYKRSLSQ